MCVQTTTSTIQTWGDKTIPIPNTRFTFQDCHLRKGIQIRTVKAKYESAHAKISYKKPVQMTEIVLHLVRKIPSHFQMHR